MHTAAPDDSPAHPAAGPSHAASYADLTPRQVAFTVGGMMLTLLLAAMDQTIVGTAMPRIVQSLEGLDRYPWVTTSYLLTSTVSVPIFAKLSDLYGRKWLYLAGVAIFIASSWLCGAAGRVPLGMDGMNQLIVFRGVQGIGGGAAMALTFTIIGDLFSPAERGRFQGLFGGVFGFASVIGPLAGGFITDHLSWRWAFYVNAPVGIAALVVLYITFPYVPPHGSSRRIDWPGLATLVGWTLPLLLALSIVNERGWDDPTVRTLFAASLCVLALFLTVEWRAAEPMIPLSLFGDHTIRLAAMAIFLVGFGMFGMFVYLPLYLQGVLGMSPAAAGSMFTPLVLMMVASSIVCGQVISRTGRYKAMAVGGSAVATAGMVLLTRMGSAPGTGEIVRNLAICGLGFGAAQPIYTIVVQNAAPPAQLGIATASLQFFRSIGSTIGVAAFGTLMLGATARASLDRGMHLVFVGGAIVMGVTFVLNALLREVPLRTGRARRAA